MGEFNYIARSSSGKRMTGKINAKTEAEARTMLRLMGMSVSSFAGDGTGKDFGLFKLKSDGGVVDLVDLRDGIVIDDASWKELQDCESKLGLAG